MDAKLPFEILKEKEEQFNLSMLDENFARKLDEHDNLKKFRDMFHYPKKKDLYCVDADLLKGKEKEEDKEIKEKKEEDIDKKEDEECLYLCGHSLGLMPKLTGQYVQRELDKWRTVGVEGHTHGDLPWAWCDELLLESNARLIGALPNEVSMMNGLTVNQHLLLISFYQPTSQRYKILLEKQAFPSDHYCIESQIRQRGLNPEECMVIVGPREGEYLLRHEDILEAIEKEGDSIAVVILGGVQYFTGQLLNMQAIAKAGHAKGCYVGFDLAHAVGNVPLKLHDWDVDFACWCTYKYLCSGAGGIAGVYIHQKFENVEMPKLLGWWGHKMETRFFMNNKMDLIPGALGYRISNTPGLLTACLQGSLHVYDQTSMEDFRAKSLLMSAYFEHLLLTKYGKNRQNVSENVNVSGVQSRKEFSVDIITPRNPFERGCQFSITTNTGVLPLFKELSRRGVLLDKREPNVLRLSFNPLYNKYMDIYKFLLVLDDCIHCILNSV
ncbi:hypothetical protein HELRODRAFT_188733 [Helobdella robusta]|uniref:Kynureninase n=1 Tax=Helobdella robusta TaxID=6412 RepID=T1FQB2_HELRO|nr:hypothetical protein HELRODRAFT_188733 [Helobdella robusta]ESO02518.1 hypothetical protein HELRODRAFT_188733 [Helobdella robusta]